MANIKYVIFACSNEDNNIIHHPIIFQEEISHNELAEVMNKLPSIQEKNGLQEYNNVTPISAGFLVIYDNQVRVRGRSQGLNLSSRKEDEVILNRMFGFKNG